MKERNKRRSIRLQGFDYGTDGAYFITVCSYDRTTIFSEIRNGEIILSAIGRFVPEEWKQISTIRDYVTIDELIVMPNHIHGILFIHKDSDEPDHLRQRGTYLYFPENYKNEFGPQKHNLASIMRGYKSAVTMKARNNGIKNRIWEGRYYERIIRNEQELDKFRNYIRNNPFLWDEDEKNIEFFK